MKYLGPRKINLPLQFNRKGGKEEKKIEKGGVVRKKMMNIGTDNYNIIVDHQKKLLKLLWEILLELF